MLYIDSGTGSMLFSIVVGLIATVIFVVVIPIIIWLFTKR